MARPSLGVGDAIGGYQLGAVLGAGGLGTVYATTGAGGERLAIKVIAHAQDASIPRRVAREVEALRRLDHPNVLRLVDAGATESWSYLVMPQIAGATLREVLAGGPLLPESAALLVLHAAHGVGAIHAAGLTHRDLKPDNIMITDDGRVVIIDLGLALAPDWTRQTTEGALAGSVPYMAPEQIDGEPGPASDVWALGVTWWELLTAQRPFARGRATEELGAIMGGARAAITDVDRRIDAAGAALLERCLDRDPARRPADGAALATAVAPIAVGGLAGTAPRDALLALRSGRAAHEAAIATRIARTAETEAAALAAQGDVFGAVRALDRGLAYCPDDAALAAAIDALVPGAGTARSSGARSRDPLAIAPTEPERRITPPRRRRWPGLVAAGALVAAAGTTAAVLATRGGAAAPRYRLDEPAELVRAVFDAARTGDASALPSLCLPGEGEAVVHAICALTPGSSKWATFQDMFRDARIEGTLRTEDGALVRYAHPREPGRFQLLRRRDRFYLKNLQ